ncbi:MAG TPA: DUF2461 domain-containing protein [Polyangia bacterium]
MAGTYFTPETFRFLRELRENNRRDWFEQHRDRYEDAARQPMLRFLTDLGPRLRRVAPEFQVDPRPVGGSMMRIHRDVRFAKDKSPYKTALAAHFGHEAGADEACPAFYLHVAPDDCAAGAGVWRPAPPALKQIRDAIVARPDEWRRATRDRQFGSACGLMGEKLARPPKGYDADHPLIEDLKRKDFALCVEISEQQVCAPAFLDDYVAACRALAPFARFLSGAVGLG